MSEARVYGSAPVVVVGLGVMGAAILDALARRGVAVVGLDRFDVPHAFGSSHGGTRVIRKAYYEDPRYVPHLHASWEAWRALERELQTTLLLQTGGLHFGPPEHPDMRGVLRSVNEHGLAHELLDAAAIARRFPMFAPDADDVGILEHEAGCLLAERAVSALVERAIQNGARVFARTKVSRIDLEREGVFVETTHGIWQTPRVVLAVGPWWPEAAPLRPPCAMTVERQVQMWFAGGEPGDLTKVTTNRMPVFLRFGQDLFYGLPFVREAGPLGVKICAHHGGAAAHPETIDRDVRAEDVARVRAFVQRHVPSADGPLLGARVCMYTNTADLHFVVGLHPDDARVAVAAGFSGHGFKLAPTVGELVARAVLEGDPAPEPLFDPRRFAGTRSG